MAFADVISICINKWRAEDIDLEQPVTEADVRRVWEKLGKNLSADVVQLYATVGGFHDNDFDPEFFWCLWPWDWLQKRNTEDPRDGVMFCDHSIEIETWELRYEDARNSSVWTAYGERTAPTMESFFQLYLEDPWRLL